MGQLPREIREALAANARTKIAFACSPDDAALLSKHFSPALSDYDLANLSVHQAACRPCIDGGHGPAFTFRSRPLSPADASRAAEVKKAAEQFAENRESVEIAIRNRHRLYRKGQV